MRQASLSLLNEIGARADLADSIERCLIPRIVRRSSPPSCSCSGCHATSLYSQRWVSAALGQRQRMPLYNDCMHCMLPASRADSQAPHANNNIHDIRQLIDGILSTKLQAAAPPPELSNTMPAALP